MWKEFRRTAQYLFFHDNDWGEHSSSADRHDQLNLSVAVPKLPLPPRQQLSIVTFRQSLLSSTFRSDLLEALIRPPHRGSDR